MNPLSCPPAHFYRTTRAGKPLFQGRDYMHQLQVIIEGLGTPSGEEMDFISNPAARKVIEAMGRRKPRRLGDRFPDSSDEAVDLLERMLVFDPRGRITIEEALAHPYLKELHDVREEPVCETPFNLSFEEGYEKIEIPKDILQSLVFQEMLAFHPEEADLMQRSEELQGAQASLPNVVKRADDGRRRK